MSTITKPMLLDETGQEILAAMKEQTKVLKRIAGLDSSVAIVTNWAEIHKAVRNGKASTMFEIGDQIVVRWTNVANESYYEMPFDVVHFGDVKLEDGSTVPGMYLQCHYMPAVSIPFDAGEGTYMMPGMTYESGFYYYAMSVNGARLLVEGTDYNVGDTIPSGSSTIMRNAIYDESGGIINGGYNKWSASAIRQLLNSNAVDGNWWSSQHDGDSAGVAIMPGTGVTAGFLSGFEVDFLDCIKAVEVCTVSEGAVDITYDKFFIPSLEQMNVESEVSGEGETFEYWREATGDQGVVTPAVGHEAYISYRISAKSTPANYFFRSTIQTNKHQLYSVNSGGEIVAANASNNSCGCLPVCVIC